MSGRHVIKRVLVRGTLVLETPAHFGNGEAEGLADITLLRDPRDDDRPLLPGTSIAGALRSYVREYQRGYGEAEDPRDPEDWAQRLFGNVTKQTSTQSWLIVDDALGTASSVEIRDGVALDPASRTASNDKKFDIELLQAGTQFPLSFELLLTEDNQEVLTTLAVALNGLMNREIGLGTRKRRGLGRCSVLDWQVRQYDLQKPRDLIAWLNQDWSLAKRGKDIYALLDIPVPPQDARRYFQICATFALRTSLLIRSGSGRADAPDMVHLHTRHNGKDMPVLPGTSLSGALRARALRIVNTMQFDAGIIDTIFGPSEIKRDDSARASRLVVHESIIKQGLADKVQQRVKIDRFTGGAYPQALFSEQPVFGGDTSEVEINLMLRSPKDHEIGLLLLLLKDLWTGDLPVGGESSVGRGRLAGQKAALTLKKPSLSPETWTLTSDSDGRLSFDNSTPDKLQNYVDALLECRREL